MRIQAIIPLPGVVDGVSIKPTGVGGVVEVGADIGNALIESGAASIAIPDKKPTKRAAKKTLRRKR